MREYSRRAGVHYFDLSNGDGEAKTHYSEVVFDREKAVADDGLTYLHLNHPVVQRVQRELAGDGRPATAQLRLHPEALPHGVSPPDGPGLWAVYCLRVTNYDDVDRQELISVYLDGTGGPDPPLARALLARGSALTVDDLRAELDAHPADLLKGYNRDLVRIKIVSSKRGEEI